MTSAKSLFVALLVVGIGALADRAQAQNGTTPNTGPNSPFWSQGFSARSQMANSLDPLNRQRGGLYSERLVHFAFELDKMNQSDVMILPGTQPVVVASGSKNRGDAIATIPFRLREMGRLAQPVTAGRDGSGQVLLEAGSIGYRVDLARVNLNKGIVDAWCFTDADRPARLCLYALENGGWTSGRVDDAFPNLLISPKTRRANASDPVMVALSFEARPEHRLELRLESWTRAGVFLKAYVDGAFVELIQLEQTSPREAQLKLLGQSVNFVRTSERGAIAIVTPATLQPPSGL
jgi:hypothetical protein